MTNTAAIPKSVSDSLSLAGFHNLKLALEMAFDNGGFDAVLAVCKDITDGAKKTDRIKGVWAATEWRGLDFIESKFPGATLNLQKYAYLNYDGDTDSND